MSHVRYIDKTREYYRAEGYERAYTWAHSRASPSCRSAPSASRCRNAGWAW